MATPRRSVVVLVALLAAAALSCGPGQAGEEQKEGVAMKVREPILAGTWYPGEPAELRQMVRGFLDQADKVALPGPPLALIVPHAGLIYSGPVAAHAWRQLEGRDIDLVVMVGPSHRTYLTGSAVWTSGTTPGAWKTPLGLVEVEGQVAAALVKQGQGLEASPEAHAAEHSLEIQLPFLQTVAPKAKIVPVMMGTQDLASAKRLGAALAAALKGYPGRFVLVASSDLSHFHPYEAAVTLDKIACSHFEKLEVDGLMKDIDSGRCEACGGGPAAAVMLAAKELGAGGARLLKYANSGDTTGDRGRVVGYGAVVIYGGGRPAQGEPKAEPKTGPQGTKVKETKVKETKVLPERQALGEAQRKLLHQIALQSVEAAARGEAAPKLTCSQAALLERLGAFVTLKRGGQLRGCIGNIIGQGPLYETIAQMARAAAIQDPRFPPLTADELKDLHIEISVLTPLELVKDPGEIVVGKHGLFIVYGASRGLLLPQVATEQGWDRRTFLEQTCWKAGLPPDAWKEPGAQIYRFGAEVF